MESLDCLRAEFDETNRIVHLTAEKEVHVETNNQLNDLCNAVAGMLDKYSSSGRCYMVVNLSMIAIEPGLAELYSEKVRHLQEKYLYPGGLARYGHQISRLTARVGYEKYLKNDPHLFWTKQEAFAYIFGLIKQRPRTGCPQPEPG